MGLRFQKRIKLFPGVRINLNKKSFGVTFGGKGLHYTINSKGRHTASAGVPGTGLYYTKSYGGSSQSAKGSSGTPQGGIISGGENPNWRRKKLRERTWFIILWLILFFPVGLYFMWRSGWRKEVKIGISALFAVSVVYSILFPPVRPESLSIEIPNQQAEYDINQEIPITLSVMPEDAETDSIYFHTSSLSVDVDDNIISTGNTEGTYDIYAYYGDIKSNTLTINVVDFEAREEAARIEAERIAEEERIQMEQEAAEQAEEETSIPEEPETSKVEENIDMQTEDSESSQNVVVNQEPSDTDTTAEKPAEETAGSSESNTQVVESQPVNSQNLVWVDDTAVRYHLKSDCSGMDAAYQVTIEQAEAMGKTPCGRCYR